MGEVYQAEADGQLVAIKILPAELEGDSGFLKWFEREAATLKALSHPNIVRLQEAGLSDGVRYLVLDFIDGRELSALVTERPRLTLAEVQPLMTSVAAALDYAHQRGYVHRDIKPSNIMVRNATGTAVLMDFGVAKFRDGRTALTNTGAVGTIHYMAPEQILASKTVDSRADIYALGVTVYEVLTGELPFSGNAGELVFAHLQQRPTDPRVLVPDLPPTVAAGILRAMEKRPEDRFQSAGEFALCLR
jgi:serine/threonine-protein kinase